MKTKNPKTDSEVKYFIFPAWVLMFLLLGLTASAQIPNHGFENWTNMGTYFNPGGWWCTNDSIASGNFYPVTRTTDHYPVAVGNYGIRIENKVSLVPAWGAYGIIWTGDINGSDHPVFPVTGHPTSLWGYYKFFPQNNDTMEIHIRLYNNGTDISGGYFKNAGPTPAWTPFNLPFSAYASADSARIMILACYDNDAPVPHGNSVLYIDNLSFDSLIVAGVAEPEMGPSITVYHNPVNEQLTIGFSNAFNEMVHVSISNLSGKEVFSTIHTHADKLVIDTGDYSDGVYLLRVRTEKSTETRKVMVLR